MVESVKLRQHAKFRGDRSSRRRDMAIVSIFQGRHLEKSKNRHISVAV